MHNNLWIKTILIKGQEGNRGEKTQINIGWAVQTLTQIKLSVGKPTIKTKLAQYSVVQIYIVKL